MNTDKLVKDLAIKNQAGKRALYGRIIKGKIVYQEFTPPNIIETPLVTKEWGKVYREVKKSPIKRLFEILFN